MVKPQMKKPTNLGAGPRYSKAKAIGGTRPVAAAAATLSAAPTRPRPVAESAALSPVSRGTFESPVAHNVRIPGF